MLTSPRPPTLSLGRWNARLALERMQLSAKEVLESRPRVLLNETLDHAPDRLLVLDLGVN